VEVEAKFRVPDAALLERLAAAARLVGYDLEPPAARRDDDVFLDTADRRLLAAGYYLRRRENADGVRITLKQVATASDDGVLRREEYELRAAADVPVSEWPRGPLRDRVLGLAGPETLIPFLELAQERRTRRVGMDGRVVAELSLDVVAARATGRLRRWYEVELEIVGDGTEDDLTALGAALRDVWGLVPESRSKFERALESAGVNDAASRSAPASTPRGGRRPGTDGRRVKDGGSGPVGDESAAGEHKADEPRPGEPRPDEPKADEPKADEPKAAESKADEPGKAPATVAAALESEPAPAEATRPVPRVKGGVQARPAAAAAAAPDQKAPATTPVADGGWSPRAAEARRKRPVVAKHDTMAEAAVAVMRLHFAKMLAHEAGTRAGKDSEELHDMRVATRRLRMALRLFADVLDAETMRPVLKGLRHTGRTLGAVRDLDVFHEKTQHYVEGLPRSRREELEPLFDAWQVEYDERRAAMVDYLDGRRYRRFVERLGTLLAGRPEDLAARDARDGASVRQVLPALLHRDLADVLAAGSRVDGAGTPLARFHELRITAKALRYTLEFFEVPLGRGAKPLIEAMKELQDHLGDLQDAVVSCGIVRDVLTWGSWASPDARPPAHTDIQLAPGLCRYLGVRQDEMERLVLTFPGVWPRVAGEEFGGRLAGLLARL